MPRPSKIVNPVTKTFRLPADLVERLEACARLRETELSDVVRELLEGQVAAYEEASQQVRRQRLRDAVVAVKGDPELVPHFVKHKGRANVVIPLNAGIDRTRLGLLMDALLAHKELEAAGEEDEIDPLLRALEGQLTGRLYNLNQLILSGQLTLKEKGGKILFQPQRQLHETVVVKKEPETDAEKEFAYLIAEKLVKKARTQRGITIYQWVGKT
jgi:hypothetical protein